MEDGMDKGLEAEAVKFEELILTEESRQLIRIFFNMTEKKKNPYEGKAEIKPLETIAMVGRVLWVQALPKLVHWMVLM